MSTSEDNNKRPHYVRYIRDSDAPVRRLLLDRLLRVSIKRRLRYDVDIPAMRIHQDKLDLQLSKIDPAKRRTPVRCNGVAADWVDMPESRDDKIILYLHGGAWMFKFPHLHHAMVAHWCRRLRARALMVDYRLAPEHRFPAGIDDCFVAWQWLLEKGVAPDNIIIAGDSAGGNFTLALLHRIKAAGDPMPACAILLSPMVDFTLSSPSMVTNEASDPMFTTSGIVGLRHHYLAPESMLSPYASPLFGDFHGLPPLFFQSSASEVLRDDSLRAAERAFTAGVPVEVELWHDMPHVFQSLQTLPQGLHALEHIADFVGRHTGWAPAPATLVRQGL